MNADHRTDMAQRVRTAKAQDETAATESVRRFSQRFNFTGREREVFALLVAGEAQKEIAATLGISEPTVRFHAVNFYAKCGVSNQRELLAFYARTLQSEVGSRIQPNISIG